MVILWQNRKNYPRGDIMTRKKRDSSRDFIMQIEKDLLRDVGLEPEFTQGLMEEFHAKS